MISSPLINSFITEVPIIETRLLICRANQLKGFYLIRDLHHERVKNSHKEKIQNAQNKCVKVCFYIDWIRKKQTDFLFTAS